MSHSKEQTQSNSNTFPHQKGTLVLLNDDFNTFDFVIDTLIEICNHESEQAEQCATLTHYRGFCEIKNGDVKDLILIKTQIEERNLTCRIDSY